jgi:copper transport protein
MRATNPIRRLITATSALVVALLMAAAASAHATLLRAEPDQGSVLDEPPRQITAWFDQELATGDASSLRVFDSSDRQVDNRDGGVDLNDAEHTSMVVTLPASLPKDTYTVRWRAMSTQDSHSGHVTAGEFTFTIGVGAPAASNRAMPLPLQSPGMNAIVIVLGFAVICAGVAGLVLRRRRT